MLNLPLTFVLCSASQKQGKDFAKFCGLLRIYELYIDFMYLFLEAKDALESIDFAEAVWFFISFKTVEVRKISHKLLPIKSSNIRVP